MKEIEIKILGIDRKTIEDRMVALGARKVFDDEVYALYFDTPDFAIRRGGGTLRLRKEGKKAVITYKGDVEDNRAKVRDEKESVVSDFEAMRSILSSLSYTVWLEMRKHRTTYVLDDVHFELDKYLDKYEYIPELLEIEGKNLHTLFRYASLLGFQEEDCRPWDALQVAAYYRKTDEKSQTQGIDKIP